MSIKSTIVESAGQIALINPRIAWPSLDDLLDIKDDNEQVLGFGKVYLPRFDREVVVYALVLLATGVGLFKLSSLVEVCLNHLHDKELTLTFNEVSEDFIKAFEEGAIDEDDAVEFWPL